MAPICSTRLFGQLLDRTISLPRLGKPRGKLSCQCFGPLRFLLDQVVLFTDICFHIKQLNGFTVQGKQLPAPLAHDFGGIGFGLRVAALQILIQVELPEDRSLRGGLAPVREQTIVFE